MLFAAEHVTRERFGQRLDLCDLNVLHLRAAYFMENNLAAIGMIHGMGVFGNALRPDLKIPWPRRATLVTTPLSASCTWIFLAHKHASCLGSATSR